MRSRAKKNFARARNRILELFTNLRRKIILEHNLKKNFCLQKNFRGLARTGVSLIVLPSKILLAQVGTLSFSHPLFGRERGDGVSVLFIY